MLNRDFGNLRQTLQESPALIGPVTEAFVGRLADVSSACPDLAAKCDDLADKLGTLINRLTGDNDTPGSFHA